MKSKKFKFLLSLLFLAVIALFQISCNGDDEKDNDFDFPPLDRGHTEANRLKFYFDRVYTADSIVPADTAEIFDFDGAGGTPPELVDSLILSQPQNANSTFNYQARIEFYLNTQNVTPIILDNYKDYIVCYRNYQTQELELAVWGNDPDGNRLGINTEWRTVTATTPGVGEMRITLNYQSLDKNGLCDPGVRIVDAYLPYRLK